LPRVDRDVVRIARRAATPCHHFIRNHAEQRPRSVRFVTRAAMSCALASVNSSLMARVTWLSESSSEGRLIMMKRVLYASVASAAITLAARATYAAAEDVGCCRVECRGPNTVRVTLNDTMAS